MGDFHPFCFYRLLKIFLPCLVTIRLIHALQYIFLRETLFLQRTIQELLFSSPDVSGVLADSGVFAFAGAFAFAGILAVPYIHAAAAAVVPDVALTLLLSCPDPVAAEVTSFASTFDFVC